LKEIKTRRKGRKEGKKKEKRKETLLQGKVAKYSQFFFLICTILLTFILLIYYL
jgi:hypothetical protein